MEIKELLASVEIPLYLRDYIKSKNVRPKYYTKKSKIPSKYNPENCAWMDFQVINKGKKVFKSLLVYKATKERVIANPHLVGTQKRMNINGQGIYNGNIQQHDRNSMIGQIKDSFRPEIKKMPILLRFPLIFQVELYDTIIDEEFSNGQDWDLDNRFFPYGKAFADECKKQGKIPDDNRYYITSPPHPIFVPVEDVLDRKLVISIYKDNRPCIINNYLYIKKHGDKLK